MFCHTVLKNRALGVRIIQPLELLVSIYDVIDFWVSSFIAIRSVVRDQSSVRECFVLYINHYSLEAL